MLFTHLIALTLLALLCNATPANPRGANPTEPITLTLTYDVVVNHRPIGRFNVAKVSTPEGVQYRVDADVTVRFLGAKRMITRFTSTYRRNLLTESHFHDQLNGRTQHDASVRWDGSGYRVQVNKNSSIIAGRQATYSSASFYDREPVGLNDLFSERYGRFCTLRSVAAHTYELTLPDGKKNYYRYVDGVCREVEVQQPLFTIYFRLRHD